MPFIVATYVYASSQGQRTRSARTNISSQYFFLLQTKMNRHKPKYDGTDQNEPKLANVEQKKPV
jgi:hypothetical protein